MFSLSDANRFFLYPFPTDMRKSFDSLSGIVKNQMGMNVMSQADKGLLSQKDAELAAKDKDLARKDKDLARKDKTIRELEDKILKLESSIAWLKCKMWGKMSEKHIPEDPNQRLIEWEGLELLPEEQEAVKSAEKEIDEMRQRQEKRRSEIAKLYSIEQEADDQHLSYKERAELRKRVAYPIMRAFEQWLIDEAPKVMQKSPIGKAIAYTYSIYYRLTRYHLDGRYLPDNNLIENSVRPIAIGRKNYLFCGNDDAAEDAAIIYTMMGCCKEAGADFLKWTNYFLDHIHEYDKDLSKPLDDFLPAILMERGLI